MPVVISSILFDLFLFGLRKVGEGWREGRGRVCGIFIIAFIQFLLYTKFSGSRVVGWARLTLIRACSNSLYLKRRMVILIHYNYTRTL